MEPVAVVPVSEDEAPIKTLSNLQAFILIFKSRFGMGLMFVPYQYTQIGLVPATILSMFIVFYSYYSINNLLKAKQDLSTRLGYNFMSYTFAFQTITGPKLLLQIIWISREILLITQNTMLCCCFTFLISSIGSVLVEGNDSYYRLFVIILILPAMFFYQISTYWTLSYFVAIAILLTTISLFLVLLDFLRELCTNAESFSQVEKLFFHDYKEIPIFIATLVFTISPISILEAIETFMRHPKRLRGWDGILSATMGINFITLVTVGILGSIAYQDKIFFSILEHDLFVDLSGPVYKVLFFISIFITTAIHFNVVFGLIWFRVFEGVFPINQELESEAAIRALLILFMYILTIFWDHLNAFVPLVGAICSIPLTFVYPYVFEFMIVWPNRANHTSCRITKTVICIIFGFCLFITTMCFTILHCYNVFTHKI